MSENTTEQLTAGECWSLLETTQIGRLAVRCFEGVDIFPLNFVVKDETVFFKTAPGMKMVDLTEWPRVAFEADGTYDRKRWSVVLKGHATRLSSSTEIEESGVQNLHTLAPLDKWNYVKIEATELTGRQFASRRRTGI